MQDPIRKINGSKEKGWGHGSSGRAPPTKYEVELTSPKNRS
jgi:hypothetical protein